MKPYMPFIIVVLGSITFFVLNPIQNYKQEYALPCSDDIFFVSIPENCQLCPQKQAKYIDWFGKSIWACVEIPPQEEEDIEISLPKPSKSNCSSDRPLKDILGHCYSCQIPYAIQIQEQEKSICNGKRYITEYRQSLKSQLCPEISQIKNPQICLSCQGKWIDEECVRWSIYEMSLCKKNSDCPANQWCYPIDHIQKYQGVCRPINNQNWICSDLDGYNSDTASLFCGRQNAHTPTEVELTNEKDAVLAACTQTNIWAIFDDGRIYLDSLKTPFVITDERNSILSGGDKTYALCRKN